MTGARPAAEERATPEVSVCLITYNHERFVGQAIESVIAQEKPFAWELVIAEDCSTDRTRTIVQEYASRHPDRIRLLLPPQNTRAMIWIDMMRAARGRFVAYLDGDDYWTEPRKLLLQREHLLAHPGHALVAHPMEIEDVRTGRIVGRHAPAVPASDYGLDDLVELGAFFCNSAVMYRASALPPEGPDPAVTRVGDWLLHMAAARHGRIGFLARSMGVYRRVPQSRSTVNRRNVDQTLRDLLYTLDRARAWGAGEQALARGRARAHFIAALGALEHHDYAVFRRELDRSAEAGEVISTMHRALLALRGVPRVARSLVASYVRMRGGR